MSTFEKNKKEHELNYGELYAKHDLVRKLIEKRAEVGVSQRKLSELSTVAQKTISRIENGIDIPSFSTLYKLSEALGYQLEILMKKMDA